MSEYLKYIKRVNKGIKSPHIDNDVTLLRRPVRTHRKYELRAGSAESTPRSPLFCTDFDGLSHLQGDRVKSGKFRSDTCHVIGPHPPHVFWKTRHTVGRYSRHVFDPTAVDSKPFMTFEARHCRRQRVTIKARPKPGYNFSREFTNV